MLPPEAVDEIMERLSVNLKISADEIVEILEKHGVSGDADALQSSYRKRLGQRLMASIRDETGKREVLSSSSGETQTAAQRSGCGLERRSKGARAVFAARRKRSRADFATTSCNDPQQLRAIQRRIQSSMNGLDASSKKVRSRMRFLNRFAPVQKREG